MTVNEQCKRNSIALDGILKRPNGKAELTVAVFDACREIPELDEAVAEATRDSDYGASAYRGLDRARSAWLCCTAGC